MSMRKGHLQCISIAEHLIHLIRIQKSGSHQTILGRFYSWHFLVVIIDKTILKRFTELATTN